MKTIALAVLMLLAPLAHASTPIMGDESLACISGGTPGKPGQKHDVSFSNGYQMGVLSPDTLVSFAVLKTVGTYSATFKVNGVATQVIRFRFQDSPGTDVCFRYDSIREVWGISRIRHDLCQACAAGSGM